MDQNSKINEIEQKIIGFYELIKDKYQVKKVFLYGSWAKNTMRKDSDIDVAVVIDYPAGKNRVKITADLFHYASMIDTAIEPKAISWEEYQNPSPVSILAEMIKTGIEIKKITKKNISYQK